jgi:hypothetical protein
VNSGKSVVFFGTIESSLSTPSQKPALLARLACTFGNPSSRSTAPAITDGATRTPTPLPQ